MRHSRRPAPALVCSRLPAALARATGVAAIPATAGRSAIRLRTRFVNVERSAVQIASVERVDCGVSFRIIAHFDKGEPSGLPCFTVSDQIHPLDRAVWFEYGTNGIFGRPEVKVTYKDVFQSTLLSGFAEQLIGRIKQRQVTDDVRKCVNWRDCQIPVYHTMAESSRASARFAIGTRLRL